MLRFLRGRAGARSGLGVYCVFVFPDSTESRWLERTPRPGTRVRSQRGRVWIVDEVLQSGRDIYTVFCVPRRAYRDAQRSRPHEQRDLAEELLEAARHARDAAVERRNRWKYRRYLP